jgi:hypothetical protein
MDSNFERRKIVTELSKLFEEQEACEKQYDSTIDEAQRIRLKRKLGELNKQINELESQLHGKDLNADDNRRFRALEDKLPKIDFKNQIKLVKTILDEFAEEKDGSALFLLNDSLNMAGDLFCLELKEMLEEDTTDLKHYEIAFSVDKQLNEIGFLQGLGSYFGLDEINCKEDCIVIFEKIFNSIENGSIVFIELKKINLLSDRECFLSWLVHQFWKSLIDNLSLNCEQKDIEQVKLIILVISDFDICREYSQLPIFCTETDFDKFKILEIQLKEWTEKDIKNWLTKHSGLKKRDVASIAREIYDSSRGGTPNNIRSALMSTLS